MWKRYICLVPCFFLSASVLASSQRSLNVQLFVGLYKGGFDPNGSCHYEYTGHTKSFAIASDGNKVDWSEPLNYAGLSATFHASIIPSSTGVRLYTKVEFPGANGSDGVYGFAFDDPDSFPGDGRFYPRDTRSLGTGPQGCRDYAEFDVIEPEMP